ncbi:MAG: hypothetical protein AVDCRST_MAG12-556, partial [uncultured Rubrobacteraceae bacterium]
GPAKQDRAGRPQRGGDGQGQGPHEGSDRRPYGQQGQKVRRPRRPAQRHHEGEEGAPERLAEV